MTRNLFELTIISDYLSRSQENRERFTTECALDSRFVLNKFEAIDQCRANHSRSDVVQAKRQRLEQKIATLNSHAQGSRSTHVIAKEIGREADYAEMYGVLSKMSHPSPWAILGGTDASLSWDSFALYLMVRANGYAAECCRHLLTPSTK